MKSLGAGMDYCIKELLKHGYRFEGLDEFGDKDHQIHGTSNPFKVCIYLGNPYNCDVLEILDNGRNFLKKYAPELVDETDEEWEEQQREARGS